MEKPIIEPNGDMSVLIKLTPIEIKNLLRDFANRYYTTRLNNSAHSLHDLADSYYEISVAILANTDPDRFEHRN